MSGANLTRDETRQRAKIIDPGGNGIEYDIELDLTTGDTTFRTTTTLRFAAQAGSSTWLDLIAPTVHKIILNGTAVDAAKVFDGVRIALADLADSNEVTVVADGAYMKTGEGMHRFADPVDDEVYLYSQFEVANARRVYACFEQPDIKGRFTFRVIAAKKWRVVSNNPGRKSQRGTDTALWKFSQTPPISTYVTAIVAGPYHRETAKFTGKNKTIPLGLYCRKSLAKHLDASELFDVTRKGFEYFEDVFELAYPFEKYDQLFVPEFNAGAMENAGCVTQHEDHIFRSRVTDAAFERRAETILHEMAHMWFGDLVTMQWWDDLWLNESFASWAATLSQAEATKWTNAWTTFVAYQKVWALRQDQLPSTHPISADIRDVEDVEVNFDGITYAKGASVLKQLVAWVGRDEFLAGVQQYFDDHRWGNTTLADLFRHLEATSGRDLTTWGKQWLQTAGVNTLTPIVATSSEGDYTSVIIEQTATDEHPTIRPHRLAIGLYDADEDGSLTRSRRIELDVDGSRTEVTELRGIPQPDLLLVNDDDLTFAKIRLDDRSRATVIRSIGSLPALPRVLCWSAATDMLRDAELPTRDYIDLLLRDLEREDVMSVVQSALAIGRVAVDTYSDPDERMLLSAKWAAGLRRLAGDVEPGRDAQLALTRGWVSTAASTEHIAQLRALLDGAADVLSGLEVDTDLRWHLLQRLVIVGATGPDEIDAELQRDNTASGAGQAALARAAIPTAEAKEAAWHAAVEEDRLPNALLTATIRGFAHAEQRVLVQPYVQRYLDCVGRVWKERTIETAQTIVVGLFPRIMADTATAETVRSWLADADIPDAARRLVTEGLADLDRALRAQQRDRSAAFARTTHGSGKGRRHG